MSEPPCLPPDGRRVRSGARFEDQVDGRFRGAPELREAAIGHDFAQAPLTRLRAQAQATSWEREAGVQMKVEAA